MDNLTYQLVYGVCTDKGRVRERNEDNCYPKQTEAMTSDSSAAPGALFVVADGMGGHAAGEVASQIAVETISEQYKQNAPHDTPDIALRTAIERANAAINRQSNESGKRGMGTTVVCAVLCEQRLHVAHAGDSRAYLLRNNTLTALTRDHTLANMLSPEDAVGMNQSIIMRALGPKATIAVEALSKPALQTLQIGDIVMLCSDGICGYLEDDPIKEVLMQHRENPHNAAHALVKMADGTSEDNETAIVILVKNNANNAATGLQVGSQPLRTRQQTDLSEPKAPPETKATQPVQTERVSQNPKNANAVLRHAANASPVHQTNRFAQFKWLLMPLMIVSISLIGVGELIRRNPPITSPQPAQTPTAQPTALATSPPIDTPTTVATRTTAPTLTPIPTATQPPTPTALPTTIPTPILVKLEKYDGIYADKTMTKIMLLFKFANFENTKFPELALAKDKQIENLRSRIIAMGEPEQSDQDKSIWVQKVELQVWCLEKENNGNQFCVKNDQGITMKQATFGRLDPSSVNSENIVGRFESGKSYSVSQPDKSANGYYAINIRGYIHVPPPSQ